MTTFTIADGSVVPAMRPVYIRGSFGGIQEVFLDGEGRVRQLLWEGRSLGTWPDYTAADCYPRPDAVPADPPARFHPKSARSSDANSR